ncbi:MULTISPECIES: XVIPCD domain-containing protein [unclassified Xanthomonas]|uniref:XVIPCD domain-containing protein n=1 Tax=unclassified Xanthomonas TaxID=2643310 RepID=UPI002882FF98|nr:MULTISPECIES: XVIPCD domain-containing protein [unclassified Xanthomonas]
MARSNDLDIRATADQISALFNANRSAEALEMLGERRQNQSEVVRDALDRYVGVASANAINTQQQGPISAADAGVLQRLQQSASSQPAIPPQTQMAALNDAQRYDVYASIVQVRGNDAAHDALSRPNERVVLGLRQENSTLAAMQDRAHPASPRSDDPATPAINEAQGGTGVYNDRLVVLWKDADGTRHTQVAQQANTEPTAQYDHHAGNTGRRPRAEGGVENRIFAPSPEFESITRPRKIEGEDVNADGIRDLGRLSEGTIEMRMGQHPNPIRPGTQDNALRPSQAAVDAGHGGVQRDSNADGWFDHADLNGVKDLNDTFKIHRGSSGSTDSAGCQTIHPAEYDGFIGAVQGNPAQTRWQYVLTSTTPGPVREQQLDQGLQQERARPGPQPRGNQPPHPQRQEGGPAEPVHGRQRQADLEPTPQAPHPLHAQATTLVGKLDAGMGRSSDAHSERMSASLAHLAKEHGLERIDHVSLSNQTPRAAAGATVFVVQGQPSNPAHLRASMPTDVAVSTPVEQSLTRLQELDARTLAHSQIQAQERSLAQEEAVKPRSIG